MSFQDIAVESKCDDITNSAPNNDNKKVKGMRQLIASHQGMEQFDATASRKNDSSEVRWRRLTNLRDPGLGQSVLQGYNRQVQGYNGGCSAQLDRPWGSTQTFPPRHNKAQRPCQSGHAVIKAWCIAHVPRVVPREGRIRLPREKGHTLTFSLSLCVYIYIMCVCVFGKLLCYNQ